MCEDPAKQAMPLTVGRIQGDTKYFRSSLPAELLFDAVVRDPASPKQMLPAYDKGDNLHPNDAGYKAMAESIDLNLLTTKP